MKINKIIFLFMLGLLSISSTAFASTLLTPGTIDNGVGNTAKEPIASPIAGTYTSSKSIALSAIGASSIRYTLDGSTPSCLSGTVYSTSISVSSTKTIKTVACYTDNGSTSPSNVASYAYTIRSASSGGGSGGGATVVTPASNIIAGCGDRTTGFSSTTGQSCLGNTGTATPALGQVIPGCDNRTTGFSYLTGVSCLGNIGTAITSGLNPTIPTLTTPGSKFIFTLPLKLGSKGNEVKELQKVLIAGGYLIGLADGSFGPKTVAAVKKYQAAYGLTADGVVGPATRALLSK